MPLRFAIRAQGDSALASTGGADVNPGRRQHLAQRGLAAIPRVPLAHLRVQLGLGNRGRFAMTHACSSRGRGPQWPSSRNSSSSAMTIGIEREPLVRYRSITSGYSSRRRTRSSSPGTWSTSLATNGMVLDASPHQSSAMTSSRRRVPAGSAVAAHAGQPSDRVDPLPEPLVLGARRQERRDRSAPGPTDLLKSSISSRIGIAN